MEPRGSAVAFHIEEGRRSRRALGLRRAEAEAREEARRREELAESRRYGLRVVGWGIQLGLGYRKEVGSGLLAVSALGVGHEVRRPRAQAEEGPKPRYANLQVL